MAFLPENTLEAEKSLYLQLFKPISSVVYEYSKSGRIVARSVNGKRTAYEYDGRNQLLAVKDSDGNDIERYSYDKAGNMLKKTVNGKTTTFTFDGANQLISSTVDGVTTRYTYDAAGRLVKEGNKTYRYGYLDKVMSVSDGKQKLTYDYHADGQIASANYGNGKTEEFLWDGLALVHRGGEHFINEPHIGGGNPVVSSKGVSYFNDMLGTTLGTKEKGCKYSAAALTAFGERLDNVDSTSPAMRSSNQTEFEAEIAWTAYRASLVQSAKELSDLARLFYRDGFLSVAASLENEAINELGKLFHTFDDSFAPPHNGFQHFSWFSALDHVARETMSVYETGIYQYWISTGQFTPPITIEVVYRTGGFRGHIYEQIDLLYTDTVKYVLRQPE